MDSRMLFSLFALVLVCGTAYPAASCASFGQDCASLSCCGSGTLLNCETFTNYDGTAVKRCNQPALMCTEIAPDWKPVITDANLHGAGSVEYAVGQVEQGGTGSIIRSNNGLYAWFYDWKTAGFIGVMITIAIISLAAMFGHAFNLPEVKAFVNTELVQALISVVLIVGLMGLIVFFDGIAQSYVASANIPVTCPDPSGVPCYIAVAKAYLTEVYDLGQTHAQEQLVKTVKLMASSSVGMQFQFNKWWAAFAGTNYRANAGLSIEGERAGLVFNTASGLLASIYAQRYFIDVISFGIAPVLLLLGILLRTFFFTRKLGGLLLAIALALFLVYPLTYAFTWYTLNIQVYGERVSATELDCPKECTANAPVAFYVNTTGGLVNFPSTQSVKQAGIDASNWDSTATSQKYPGFVSCVENLFGNPTAGTNPPSDCPSACPSYCREVPFPSQYPECNFAACSSCNPGCKVYRARTDCYKKSVCDPATCPTSCRTKVPYENKCYVDYVTGSNGVTPAKTVMSANLANTCSGCALCPTWCKIRKANASGAEPAYPDAECQVAACLPPTMTDASGHPGTCPDACVYVSPFGATNQCDSLCRKNGVVCPDACRFSTSLDLSKYDLEDFNSAYCQSGTYKPACDACPDVCRTAIPQDPRTQPSPTCYPYPQKNYQPTECTDCPEYCRFSDYTFIPDPPVSNNLKTGGVPPSCGNPKYGCSASTSPAECGGSCKTSAPPVCIAFQSYEAPTPGATYPPVYCNQCPQNARVKLLTHIDRNGVPDSPVAPAVANSYCSSAACSDGCKLNSVALPTQTESAGACKDFDSVEYSRSKPRDSQSRNCAVCPYGCRVSGMAVVQDASCSKSVYDDAGSSVTGGVCDATYCSDSCKAGTPGPTCKAYVGAGSNCGYLAAWHNGDADCGLITKQTDCDSAKNSFNENVCEWNVDESMFACYGPSTSSGDCQSFEKPACIAHLAEGCKWLGPGDERIPIGQRKGATANPDLCALCPENCRLGDSDYDCYVKDNTLENSSNAYIDCSIASCPATCRAPMPPIVTNPQPPATEVCRAFIPFELPCAGTPMLCRRPSDIMPPVNTQYCSSFPVCSGSCVIPSPTTEACSGCYECDYDCIYNPTVRTDCGEVCSDEALQGPINIGPSDFHKKLPGAEGATDVKNAGVLLVLGLVLPLFNIVIVIAFIRVLSPVLGGDIEIPGLGRII